MYTVWKFELPVDPEPWIDMPVGTEVLSVQVQHGKPVVWARVDPEEKRRRKYWFVLVGTGHPMMGDPEEMTFVGTFQLDGGALVFHLFGNGTTAHVVEQSGEETKR